jgi:hypothetical protein
MAKYSVTIPSPSAKRMAGRGKVIVRLNHGCDYGSFETYPVPADLGVFEFTVGDEYEWLYSSNVKDGISFSVECVYTNSTGTRTEVKQLVPEKI